MQLSPLPSPRPHHLGGQEVAEQLLEGGQGGQGGRLMGDTHTALPQTSEQSQVRPCLYELQKEYCMKTKVIALD